VAQYVDTDTPMAEAGEAYLETSGFTRTPPGFQLVVDLDSDGTNDGILVGGAQVLRRRLVIQRPRGSHYSNAPGTGHGYGHAHAGTRHTFADDVVLTNKDQCEDGGWVTSTLPEFRDQGERVSSIASKKK
jgi:hypothetical protein